MVTWPVVGPVGVAVLSAGDVGPAGVVTWGDPSTGTVLPSGSLAVAVTV